ncbi:shikimate dehydrogenase family protein [Streptomyces aculeolatus]
MSHENTAATGITGGTRLFAVIGDPVAQVRAPELVNPVLRAVGMDAVLVPVHAPVAHLADVVRGLQRTANLDGILVTVPHKEAARRFAEVHSPAVRLAASTNAMRREPDGRWYAENFDGAGFVAGLVAAGQAPAGRRIVLVGAGGAGSALAPALLAAGAARVQVCDVDRARQTALLARLRPHWPDRVDGGDPDLRTADIAVNATPLGLRPADPLPFRPAGLPPGALVADIVMKPRETPLLRAARECGLRVHHGHHMLERQLDLYRSFFGLGTDRAPAPAGAAITAG